MGNANIPNDWTGEYQDFVVRWPLSDQWEAILRGQLNNPAFEDFWDLFSGDPAASMEAMWETFDTNLHLQEGAVLPSGLIADYAGGTIPPGWLLCDGSAVSRVTYAELFAAIGTIYGPGNGTTTFNLPEDIGRVKVAQNEGDANFGNLGDTGGTKTVFLNTSEIPSHTHTQDSHTHTQDSHTHTQDSHTHTLASHTHTQDSHNHTQNSHNHTIFGLNSAAGGGALRIPTATTQANDVTSGSSTATNQASTATNQSATPTISGTTASNQQTTATNQASTATNISATATNQNTGGGSSHLNMQPYFVYKSLIKI